jgi:hypothetical protein
MALAPVTAVWREASQSHTREGLRGFLDSIEAAQEEGQLETAESFAAVLTLGLERLHITPADLSREEQISKAALSRWMRGETVPAVPTRKHVISCLKTKAEQKLEQLEIR